MNNISTISRTGIQESGSTKTGTINHSHFNDNVNNWSGGFIYFLNSEKLSL